MLCTSMFLSITVKQRTTVCECDKSYAVRVRPRHFFLSPTLQHQLLRLLKDAVFPATGILSDCPALELFDSI